MVRYHVAFPMHLTLVPVANIVTSVWPVIGPLAFFLIHDELSFVSLSVRPLKYSVAVHLVIFPAAVELAPVFKFVPALAL